MYTDEQERLEEEEERSNKENDENSVGINEVMLEKRLLKSQPMLRRIKITIEWLEKLASESKNYKLVKQKISEFNEKCAGWEHTLHHLKHSSSSFNKKERLNTYSSREFVDELVLIY